MAPGALPWAEDLLGFQPAQGRRQGFFRTISIYLIILDFEQGREGVLNSFPARFMLCLEVEHWGE